MLKIRVNETLARARVSRSEPIRDFVCAMRFGALSRLATAARLTTPARPTTPARLATAARLTTPARLATAALLAAAAVLAAAAGSAGAANEVRLTAVSGETSTSSGALDAHTDLADGQEIETADESGCSALVDQNAVVELCDETRVSFSTDPKRGNRIVNLEAGTLRMLVEKREPGERIEIHTPAAIATILGTILYVTVDPATGEETFTSSDSEVNVRRRASGDCTPSGLPAEPGVPPCAKGTTIGGLEQLRIAAGAKSFETTSVSEQELARLGGCLIDFHELAARIDRATQEDRTIDRVISVDVASADLPPVSVEDGVVIDESESGGELDAELEPFDDSSQEELIRESLTPDDPSGCGGIPGEHCDF